MAPTAAFDISLAVLERDGSPPENAILVPWPVGLPIPQEGHSFIFADDKYLVADAEFNYCGHHEVPMVHYVLFLAPDTEPGGDGLDIVLP